MILADPRLPLDPDQRKDLAILTRRHRGRIGRRCLQLLSIKGRSPELCTILAILRAADALDGRRSGSPPTAFRLIGRQLYVECDTLISSRHAQRIRARLKKLRLLERVLDVRLRLDFVRQPSLRAAA
jgi:hypothetical protein